MRRWTCIAASLILLMAATPHALRMGQDNRRLVPMSAAPGRRLALVIGNDRYLAAPLTNARNDARSVHKALQDLQFTVTLVEDATRERFAKVLEDFSRGLADNDLAFFFYAGHGVSVGAENFLMPTDFSGRSEDSVRFSGIPVSLITQLTSRARISVVVLDACRDNPFKGTRGGGGLVPMEVRGSLIAFASAAGETASDNTGAPNGVFTAEFLKVLLEPGLGVRDIFQRVRQQVLAASSGKQFPAVYDNLVGDLILKPGLARSTPPASAAARLVVDVDTDLAVSVNGSTAVLLAAGQAKSFDVVPGPQVITYTSSDGLLKDVLRVNVPSAQQASASLTVRSRLITAQGERARSQFEAALADPTRDARSLLQPLFATMSLARLATDADSARMRDYIGSWAKVTICNGGGIDNRAVGPPTERGKYWSPEVDGKRLGGTYWTDEYSCHDIELRTGVHELTFDFEMDFDRASFDDVKCRTRFQVGSTPQTLHIRLKLGRTGNTGVIESCTLGPGRGQ